ncbi:MAG: aminopeptidase, partial [Akkermansiaceae bacterium]|nr:aminopeptidase [Akkermansiaceae bacterium]
STLGWFGDPVLNTFVGLPRPALAALICHELAHARQFFPGDTALSEAFATVVEEEALERWLAREGTEEEGLRYLRRKLEVSN